MRVHAWGLDDGPTVVWFILADRYVVKYTVRPSPQKIDIQGPQPRELSEAVVLAWTSTLERAGLRMGWGFYTAEIDEATFVDALETAREGYGTNDWDDVFDAILNEGTTEKINEPRNW